MTTEQTLLPEAQPTIAPETLKGIDLDMAVRVRGLVKRYKNGTEANRGIDLDIRRGELISILGPNGAGKTTFLRQITTELLPTGGTIEIFGLDAVAVPQRVKRMMGITPQEAGVFGSLTVSEHF